MTNKEKAEEIAQNNRQFYYEGDIGSDDEMKSSEKECYDSAMEMSKWKDEQFVKEKEGLQEIIDALDARLQKSNDSLVYYFDKCNIQKQQLIDNACKWLKNNWREYVYQDENGIVYFGHWEFDFRKAIEE